MPYFPEHAVSPPVLAHDHGLQPSHCADQGFSAQGGRFCALSLGCAGRHVTRGGLQFSASVVGERFAVAEAGDRGIEVSQPPKRGGCLGAADVEDATDDVAVRAAGRSVSSEQDLMPGEVDRDAAWRVTGSGHRHGAVAEAKFVAVPDLAVDRRRDDRFCRELAHDLVVDRPFPARLDPVQAQSAPRG